jgi:hypothetical protein
MGPFNWDALGGAIIGGSTAIVATVITQLAQAHRETKHRLAEQSERREQALKEAYANWFASCSRLITIAATFVPAPQEDQAHGVELLKASQLESMAFGTRVRLLEPDARAREKTGWLIAALGEAMARMVVAGPGDVRPALAEMNSFIGELAKFEEWLIVERFGPQKKI